MHKTLLRIAALSCLVAIHFCQVGSATAAGAIRISGEPDIVALGREKNEKASISCAKCDRSLPAEYRYCPYDGTLLRSESRITSEVKAFVRDGDYIAYNNGTVLDSKNGLMWAAKDNGRDIDWQAARSYCGNLRLGGFADWRLPSFRELETLFNRGVVNNTPTTGYCPGSRHLTDLINVSCGNIWADRDKDMKSGDNYAQYNFVKGLREWTNHYSSAGVRVLPVRGVLE